MNHIVVQLFQVMNQGLQKLGGSTCVLARGRYNAYNGTPSIAKLKCRYDLAAGIGETL